ncbi:MAG: alpha/beta hydrolase [Trueperaceae bacterium]|nr:alpha/beta hydrolase [Trueperaceae bacterium]
MSHGFVDDALHVIREGADLYVEQVGPADAPVVLFLHGGPGASAHAFRELLGEDLEPYRMVYLDQRGGGRSYADAAFDLDTLADDAAAVIEALRLPGVTTLAHGFGAAVAVRLAVRHPRLVRGHVWLNPWLSMPVLAATLHRHAHGAGDDEGRLRETAEAAIDPAGSITASAVIDPDALVDEAFAAVGAKPLFDALFFPNPAVRLQLEHAESSVLLGPSESVGLSDPWHVDVSRELGRLAGPVAVLLATGDGSCYPDQAELALEPLPRAVTAFLEGGHHPYLDDPEAFLAALHAALAHAGAQT